MFRRDRLENQIYELAKRVTELERRVPIGALDGLTISVSKQPMPSYAYMSLHDLSPYIYKLPLKYAIEKVAEHVGCKFVYVPGTEETVKVEKKR